MQERSTRGLRLLLACFFASWRAACAKGGSSGKVLHKEAGALIISTGTHFSCLLRTFWPSVAPCCIMWTPWAQERHRAGLSAQAAGRQQVRGVEVTLDSWLSSWSGARRRVARSAQSNAVQCWRKVKPHPRVPLHRTIWIVGQLTDRQVQLREVMGENAIEVP